MCVTFLLPPGIKGLKLFRRIFVLGQVKTSKCNYEKMFLSKANMVLCFVNKEKQIHFVNKEKQIHIFTINPRI